MGGLFCFYRNCPQFAAEVETQRQQPISTTTGTVPQPLSPHLLLKATNCSFSKYPTWRCFEKCCPHAIHQHSSCSWWQRTHSTPAEGPGRANARLRIKTLQRTPRPLQHISIARSLFAKGNFFLAVGATFTMDMVFKRDNEYSENKQTASKLSNFCDNQGRHKQLNKEERNTEVLFC